MHKTKLCNISHKHYSINNLTEGKYLRQHIFDLIKEDHPDFNEDSYICLKELNKYRKLYLENILKEDSDDKLSKVEQEVIESVSERDVLSTDIESDIERNSSITDKISDSITSFVGSWTFILSFAIFCSCWMLLNIFGKYLFDPYPFILLNLALSCLAAIQAPFILMSQNRKEAKDRQRSENDYKINLKAELEIRMLHEKIDHLMHQQNKRFIEIQQIQMDLMEDILDKVKSRKG